MVLSDPKHTCTNYTHIQILQNEIQNVLQALHFKMCILNEFVEFLEIQHHAK